MTKSLRAASFFSKSKLPLQKWLILIYWWIRQYPVGDAAEEAKVSRETAINVYQWLFGMVDISHDPALRYMEIVQQ